MSWARAAGVVQRLVDEGAIWETPVVSLPELETDEPLEEKQNRMITVLNMAF